MEAFFLLATPIAKVCCTTLACGSKERERERQERNGESFSGKICGEEEEEEEEENEEKERKRRRR